MKGLNRRPGSRRWAAGLALTLAIGSGMAQAETLLDAWIEHQRQQPSAIAWSHAFALHEETARELTSKRRRLIEELRSLEASAGLTQDQRRREALAEWRQHLAAMDPQAARTPGRVDLPWLGANLRHNPPLERLHHWGWCQPPGWVEVWSLDGVDRLPWRAAMSLDDTLAALSSAARRDADHAMVIAPQGESRRYGVAAWNYQDAALAPGSRVFLELPNRRGLRAALPFPGAAVETDLINERLPQFLATRLPGDECEL